MKKQEIKRVGIVDADLIERKKHRFPNLVCEKISAYWKDQGAETTLLLKIDKELFSQYDLVTVSKVFTDTPVPEWLIDPNQRPDNVEIGGTGFYFDKAPNLPDEIEHHMPDYSLYDEWISLDVEKAEAQSKASGKAPFQHCPLNICQVHGFQHQIVSFFCGFVVIKIIDVILYQFIDVVVFTFNHLKFTYFLSKLQAFCLQENYSGFHLQ